MKSADLMRVLRAVGVDEATAMKAVDLVEEERLAKGRARSAKYRNNKETRHANHVTHVTGVTISPPPKRNSNPLLSASLRSAAPALPDARTMLFQAGLEELAALTGRTPSKLRPLLGRWLRDADDDALRILTLITKAAQDRPIEPIPWIERHLHPSNGAMRNGYHPPLTDISKAF